MKFNFCANNGVGFLSVFYSLSAHSPEALWSWTSSARRVSLTFPIFRVHVKYTKLQRESESFWWVGLSIQIQNPESSSKKALYNLTGSSFIAWWEQRSALFSLGVAFLCSQLSGNIISMMMTMLTTERYHYKLDWITERVRIWSC